MSLTRRLALAATLAGLLPLGLAQAYQKQSKIPVNIDTAGLALRGYDPVAYFTLAKPTPGLATFSAKHDGATYHFASAEHQAMFAAEPAKYVPQFGGYCAFAAAKGSKFDADPTLWAVVDGKLYVNFNADVSQKWKADTASMIKEANAKWPTIKDSEAK